MTEESELALNNEAYFELRFNEVRRRIYDVSDIEVAHRYTATLYEIKSDLTSNIAYRIDCLASLSRQLEVYLSGQEEHKLNLEGLRKIVELARRETYDAAAYVCPDDLYRELTTQAVNTGTIAPPSHISADRFPNRIDDSWPPKSNTLRARFLSLETMADVVFEVSHLSTDDEIKAGLSSSLDPEFGAYPLHLACEIIKAYKRRGRTGLEETAREVARAITEVG